MNNLAKVPAIVMLAMSPISVPSCQLAPYSEAVTEVYTANAPQTQQNEIPDYLSKWKIKPEEIKQIYNYTNYNGADMCVIFADKSLSGEQAKCIHIAKVADLKSDDIVKTLNGNLPIAMQLYYHWITEEGADSKRKIKIKDRYEGLVYQYFTFDNGKAAQVVTKETRIPQKLSKKIRSFGEEALGDDPYILSFNPVKEPVIKDYEESSQPQISAPRSVAKTEHVTANAQLTQQNKIPDFIYRYDIVDPQYAADFTVGTGSAKKYYTLVFDAPHRYPEEIFRVYIAPTGVTPKFKTNPPTISYVRYHDLGEGKDFVGAVVEADVRNVKDGGLEALHYYEIPLPEEIGQTVVDLLAGDLKWKNSTGLEFKITSSPDLAKEEYWGSYSDL